METRAQQLAHLEQLAGKLVANGFRAEVVDEAAKPCLLVASVYVPAVRERVACEQADDGSWSYWWPWQQRIGSVEDLVLVMNRIALVLREVEADG